MYCTRSVALLLAALTSTGTIAAKPGGNTSPQDVNVVNEIKLDPNQTFKMIVTDPSAGYKWVGYADGVTYGSYTWYRAAVACREAFTRGRVSSGNEIRDAIADGFFELPTTTALYDFEMRFQGPSKTLRGINSSGADVGPSGGVSYKVSCSAPTQ